MSEQAIVICKKSNTCLQDCAEKIVHYIADCAPCPFDDNVKCIKVKIKKTVLVYDGEEIEFKDSSQ